LLQCKPWKAKAEAIVASERTGKASASFLTGGAIEQVRDRSYNLARGPLTIRPSRRPFVGLLRTNVDGSLLQRFAKELEYE
jgi:hypothetical protein